MDAINKEQATDITIWFRQLMEKYGEPVRSPLNEVEIIPVPATNSIPSRFRIEGKRAVVSMSYETRHSVLQPKRYGPGLRTHENCQKQTFRDVLAREICHAIIHSAELHPWSKFPQVDDSKHLCRSWVWVCSLAWGIDASTLVCAAKSSDLNTRNDVRKKMIFVQPLDRRGRPRFKAHYQRCLRCNTRMSGRTNKRFCRDACRKAYKRLQDKLKNQ